MIGSPPVIAVSRCSTTWCTRIDRHPAALDAKSGALRWDVAVDDNKLLLPDAGALAIDGKIIVGVSGAENGIRGFIDGYREDRQEAVAQAHHSGAR